MAAVESEQVPRAARSVHLSYPAPDAVLFYNEMMVEKSTGGSYFMACGWNTGYFGIQELANHRKVILFSVWDKTDADDPNSVESEDRVECLYQAPDVKMRRFGGEGTGGQCMGDFDWALGETNRFVVRASVEAEKTSYSGYVWIGSKKVWKRLVTFRVQTGKAASGKSTDKDRAGEGGTAGTALRGLYSFVEDFRRDAVSADEVRRARFGNGWVQSSKGDWMPLDRAKFTASNSPIEAKETIDAGFDGAWFYLVTGGQTKRTAELKETIQGGDRKRAEHPEGLPE